MTIILFNFLQYYPLINIQWNIGNIQILPLSYQKLKISGNRAQYFRMKNYWNLSDPRKKPITTNPKTPNMQKILANVNMKILAFLEDLHFVYTSNNIHFDVVYLQDALIRLLTPFELNNSLKPSTHSDFSHFEQRNPFLDKAGFSNIQEIQGRYKTSLDDLKLIPTPYQQKQGSRNNSGTKPNKKNKNNFTRRERGRPILTQQMQAELVDWALNKLRQNKRVRRKDLAKRALRLCGNKDGFAGSIGWVNRFLIRHTRLSTELKKVARNNIGVRYGYMSDSSENQLLIDKLQQNEQNIEEAKNSEKLQAFKQQFSSEQDAYDRRQQENESMSNTQNYASQMSYNTEPQHSNR